MDFGRAAISLDASFEDGTPCPVSKNSGKHRVDGTIAAWEMWQRVPDARVDCKGREIFFPLLTT